MSSPTSSEMPPANMTLSSTSNSLMQRAQSLIPSVEGVKAVLKEARVSAAVIVAVCVAIAIFVFSQDKVYELSNQYLGKYVGPTVDPVTKKPTQTGLIVHGVVGALVVGVVVYFGYSEVMDQLKKMLA